MARTYIEVSGLGEAFLPGKFAEACWENPIRRFAAEEGSRNQAMKFLKRGGAVVLTGAWPAIVSLHQEILKHEEELLPAASGKKERILAVSQPPAARAYHAGLDAHRGRFHRGRTGRFPGEESLPDGVPTLLPVHEAEQLLQIPDDECPVRAIGASVVAHPDVLVPQSQETIDLMCQAIASCEPGLPGIAEGPGDRLRLGGLVHRGLADCSRHKSPSITATDILREAVATTRLNWRRLAAIGKAGPEEALTTRSGNLFEPVRGQVFDLIIFNAPWVVAPAHNRAELALNDERQSTIRAFVESSPEPSRAGGARHRRLCRQRRPQGNRAARRLLRRRGPGVQHLYKDRIHTRRAKRQWQSIYAYVLGM